MYDHRTPMKLLRSMKLLRFDWIVVANFDLQLKRS